MNFRNMKQYYWNFRFNTGTVFDDYDAMLDSRKIEAIFVATSDYSHPEIATKAFDIE